MDAAGRAEGELTDGLDVFSGRGWLAFVWASALGVRARRHTKRGRLNASVA